jgi:hypothetical protein
MTTTPRKTTTRPAVRRDGEDIPALAHADGCPQRDERIERYTTLAPDGAPVAVVRCQDCGAATYTTG